MLLQRILVGLVAFACLFIWPLAVIAGAFCLAAGLLLQRTLPRIIGRHRAEVGAAPWLLALAGGAGALVWPGVVVPATLVLLLGAVVADLVVEADHMGHDLAHDVRQHHEMVVAEAERQKERAR